MRILLFYLILLSFKLLSQNSVCSNAQIYCPNYGTAFPANANAGNAPQGPNYGCLGSQPNPAWFYLNVSASGTISIQMSALYDIDYIAYGPYSTLANICSSLTSANVVGCSYSGSASETLTIPNAITGEYYMVMVTNFSNQNQMINMSQISGNGSVDCNYLPVSYTHSCGSTYTITSPPSSLTNVGYTLQPGGLTSTTPTFVISPTISATYSVFCSGINSQSVVQTFSGSVGVTLVVNNAPTLIPFSSSPTICVGQSSTIDVIATSNCTWSNGVINSNFTASPSVTTSYTVTADSISGCTGSAVVTQYVDLCTNLQNNDRQEKNIFVYPNPAYSCVYIEMDDYQLSAVSDIFLKDILGRYYEINCDMLKPDKLKISFGTLFPGIYFISFKSGAKLLEIKLIVAS